MSDTRRGFLHASTFGIASLTAARALGANSRINVGIIGVGGNGGGMLKRLVAQSSETKDVQVVAISDIYALRKERAATAARLTAKDIHHDYGELIARKDIDAVFISTPDHWHSRMAIDAMNAGKDVYLQKPMTLTIAEAKEVSAAAAKLGRVLQVGSQHLSDPRLVRAREILQSGEIGEPVWAQTTYSRNSAEGEWNYYIDEEATPTTIDWDRWLGSASRRPFSPERYFRWRKYWDYSGGIATDLFYHRLGPLLSVLGPQFPTRVTGSGGIYVHKDREVPDTYSSVIEYPNFYVNISGSTANAAPVKYFPQVIYGHKGTLLFEDDGLVVTPEVLTGKREPQAKRYAIEESDVVRLHTDNFFDCIKSRKSPALSAGFGYQIMVAIKLGVDSYRDGSAKLFDPARQETISQLPARPGYEGAGKNFQGGRRKRV